MHSLDFQKKEQTAPQMDVSPFTTDGDVVPVAQEVPYVPVEPSVSGGGRTATAFVLTSQKENEFQDIMLSFEVQDYFARQMRALLCGTKRVLIVDNSSSMNQGLSDSPLQAEMTGVVRRMNELAHFVKNALPILTIDSPEGVDVWFLNEPDPDNLSYGHAGPVCVGGVHQFNQIEHLLQRGKGLTPLVTTLKQVLQTYKPLLTEEGVHIIIATDGAPSDAGGMPAAGRQLRTLLMNRPLPHKSVVNFLVCTDRDEEVAYLNGIDKACLNVDVIDDYNSERNEVLSKGRVQTFSMGDYVTKVIVGGANAEIDQADETPQNSLYEQRKARDARETQRGREARQATAPKPEQCCVLL